MSSRPTGSSPCMFPRKANEGLACVLPGSVDTSSTRSSSPCTLVPMLVTEDTPAHGPACSASSADARSALERYLHADGGSAASARAAPASAASASATRASAGAETRRASIRRSRRDV